MHPAKVRSTGTRTMSPGRHRVLEPRAGRAPPSIDLLISWSWPCLVSATMEHMGRTWRSQGDVTMPRCRWAPHATLREPANPAVVESGHGDGGWRDVWIGRRSRDPRRGTCGVSLQMRVEPCPVDHLLDPALRLPRVRPRPDTGSRAREGARGSRTGGGDRRPVAHREASPVRGPHDERAVSPRLLGAGVRGGPVPVPAPRLLR